MDRGSWRATVHGVAESDTTEVTQHMHTGDAGDPGSIPGLGSSLLKEIPTHSSILARRIPMDRGAWPMGSTKRELQSELQSMGSQRVRHD